jgi:large subunit ribosomal protein L6
MSRIGKNPITIPNNVKLKLDGQQVHVEGPKGTLDLNVHPRMKVTLAGNELKVSRPTNMTQDKSLHGLTRSLINNMIIGATEEFTKTLEIEGIGFRSELRGKVLNLQLGFSHPIVYEIPEGVRVEVIKQTRIIVKGASKALVGQVAADIRHFYEPEPYKGKGIRYSDEHVRRKAGKAAG